MTLPGKAGRCLWASKARQKRVELKDSVHWFRWLGRDRNLEKRLKMISDEFLVLQVVEQVSEGAETQPRASEHPFGQSRLASGLANPSDLRTVQILHSSIRHPSIR